MSADLKAYWIDETEIYAAPTALEAMALYEKETGEKASLAEQLVDAELDREFYEHDENEEPTGKTATLRQYLNEMTEPGWLAGSL